MNPIVAETIKIIKQSKDAITREKKLWHYIIEKMVLYVSEALEVIDDELAESYRKKGYRTERKDVRTIQSIFGAVTFKRRLMKKSKEKGIYPLDRELGIAAYQRYTPYFMYCVAQIAAASVYRSTAQAVNLLTPVTMSHQQVGAVVKSVGKQYGEWENIKANAKQEAKAELKTPEVLYIEGDGVIIRGQKQKKIEMHRFQIAEGVKTNGKRKELVGTQYFASLKRTEAVKQVKSYLENNYDLSKTIVLSNSDGGSGYEKTVFDDIVDGCMRHEHFRDRYHVERKIKESLNFIDKRIIISLQIKIRQYDQAGIDTILDTAESLCKSDEEEKQVTQLRAYLKRNWKWLKPGEQRELLKWQKGLGTCESNHRAYTYRMKKQGRRWSNNGGEAMLKIITGLRNQDLDRALTEGKTNNNKKQSRLFNGAVRMALQKANFVEHKGVKNGRITNYSPSSSAMGQLVKAFS